MTTDTQTAKLVTIFASLDDGAKRLMFEVINGLSHGRLSCDELEAAEKRIRAGADKIGELETLVDLSNHRIYDAAVAEAGEAQ